MTDLDVLVVGAGPTGLVLASELLRRGATVRVIDKLAAPTPHSRALGVHARTLEILDDLGIADALIARGLRIVGTQMQTATTVLAKVDFDDLDSRYPFMLCASQVETEAVLRDHFASLGGTIDRAHELVSFAERDGGVDAVLRTPRGDEHVRAAWIAGCDGAHSTVRHAVGAAFVGHAYEDTFALADVRIDWDAPTDRANVFLAEDGVAAIFPIRGERWRVIASLTPELGDPPASSDGPAEPDLAIAQVQAIVEHRVGRAMPMHDVAWVSKFRINCRQVDRYRHGRAFLAGDAAHVHSPIGGQGMNTGIQDAHNLAWKLALVCRGAAGEALLDSYTAERHPIGQHVLAQTDRVTRLGMLTGVAASLRNQLVRVVAGFDPVRRRVARDASELDVAYADSPIVGERVTSTWVARLGTAEAGETPTVGTRIAFANTARPGTRMLDGAVWRSVDGASASVATRLAKVVASERFTLLLFDGRATTAEGYAALAAIAERVRARFGDHIATHVVVPTGRRPANLPAALSVLHDVERELEVRYAAATECLYLVRPDLYIGFRSQPADGDAVMAYCERFLA